MHFPVYRYSCSAEPVVWSQMQQAIHYIRFQARSAMSSVSGYMCSISAVTLGDSSVSIAITHVCLYKSICTFDRVHYAMMYAQDLVAPTQLYRVCKSPSYCPMQARHVLHVESIRSTVCCMASFTLLEAKSAGSYLLQRLLRHVSKSLTTAKQALLLLSA